MARTQIDRDKLRVFLRRLRKDDLLHLLDRAIDMLPESRLSALVEGSTRAGELKPDGGCLLVAVETFREASLRGDYYEDFAVNSKNYMELSRGTETWIAECNRLLDRCVATVEKNRLDEVRKSLETLFGLLRHIDEGHDDIVFFADEGGSWQVGVSWEEVLPAYLKCLAAAAEPDEYAEAVTGLVDDFVHYDRDKFLRKARIAANPAQKRALRGA